MHLRVAIPALGEVDLVLAVVLETVRALSMNLWPVVCPAALQVFIALALALWLSPRETTKARLYDVCPVTAVARAS